MFTIKFTGEMKDWGCGILQPELVQQFGKYFIMKPGHTVEEIENETIEIIPCSEEETQKVKEQFGIPDEE